MLPELFMHNFSSCIYVRLLWIIFHYKKRLLFASWFFCFKSWSIKTIDVIENCFSGFLFSNYYRNETFFKKTVFNKTFWNTLIEKMYCFYEINTKVFGVYYHVLIQFYFLLDTKVFFDVYYYVLIQFYFIRKVERGF